MKQNSNHIENKDQCIQNQRNSGWDSRFNLTWNILC